MSRLPTPGFSRLKAPGFSKPGSVAAASQVPLPADETLDDEIFKKPQQPPQLQQSRNIPSATGLRKPKTNVLRIPKSQTANNSHGPSPYERSKPQSNNIPYLGKKRTIGSLKAPESKNTSISKTTTNNKNTSRSFESNETITKEPEEQKTMGNIQKPVKRQLIPPAPNSKSKLIQPRGAIARPKSSTGMVQPRGSQPKIKSPMSSKKGISRSLQSLPQTTQARNTSSKMIKSTSSDNLLNGPPKQGVKPRTNIGKPSLLNKIGKPSSIRPRASSHNPASGIVNISTPCQPGPAANKHLNKLKISPIVDINGSKQVVATDTTFDTSQTIGFTNVTVDMSNSNIVTPDDSNSSFDIISNESTDNLLVANTVGENSLNATYNKLDIPNSSNRALPVIKDYHESVNVTTVISDNSAATSNNNNYLYDLNQTHVIPNNLLDATQVLSNEQGNLTCDLPNSGNTSTNFLNQTRVLPSNHLPIDASLNATHVISQSSEKDNDAFDDSDFLENQAIPTFEDTPDKNNVTLNESVDNNSSFTDDILKVIAAISSNINTQPIHSIVMTTSPIKSNSLLTEHVLRHEIINNGATESFDNSKSNILSEASTIKNDTLDSSQLQELELDIVAKPKSNSIADFVDLPTTPVKEDTEDENYFSISNRCYTVSAAELRRNKVSRRNTFQAHDSSKFRVPKEINMLETLEGNILMDNTSFLQLSNDTRAIKTMLLKLKRTLIEVDCPSPLVKAPLKRSVSCAARKTGDPISPLLPRAAISSPMAVVDPFTPTEKDQEKKEEEGVVLSEPKTSNDNVPEKGDSMTNLTEKFQESLRRIEELEKEAECNKYTIKLLQTQMETTEQKEQDMFEENIILREEVNHLNERIQRLLARTGSRERDLSSSESYKEEFDLADTESRKGILQRMYSNEASNE